MKYPHISPICSFLEGRAGVGSIFFFWGGGRRGRIKYVWGEKGECSSESVLRSIPCFLVLPLSSYTGS